MLKNEVRNQKEMMIQTLLIDERKERWKTKNKRNLKLKIKFTNVKPQCL